MKTLKLKSYGPFVFLLQSILKKIGFYNDLIDGIFGESTRYSVISFQKDFKISPDGIVGEITWSKLAPYINGYTNYIVRNKDSLFSIANRFNTNINRIVAANPTQDLATLFNGQTIIVPFSSVIPTNINYSYDILDINIPALKKIYPFLTVGSIGKSALNKIIPYIRFGNGPKEVFYSAAIHANEWITAVLLMKFLENISLSYVNNSKIFGISSKEIFENTSIYIVPMCNPDGVDLVTKAIKNTSIEYNNAKNIANNYPIIPFPLGWKANIKGIDLNLQFPAGWEEAKNIKFNQGFTTPAPRDFVGDAPLVAPEAINLYDFTKKHNFSLIIAYHTQGEVIYPNYLNYMPENTDEIANKFAAISGYNISRTPYNSSFAGFKDWFIKEYNKPGFTIEVGLGDNPIPITEFDAIYQKNEGILVYGSIV